MLDKFFSVPIWNEHLWFDYDSVVKKCYEIKSKSAGRNLTNIGGWQSNDIDLSKFTECYSLIEDSLRSVCEDIHPDMFLKIDNAWININKGLNYNSPHEHPLSAISGVLYLKCNKNSGNIKFESSSLMRHYPLNSYGSKLFQTYIEYQPKVGDLILFPSWLTHSVLPSLDNEDRISIAFNTSQNDTP